MRAVKDIDKCFDADSIDTIRTWLVAPHRHAIKFIAKHDDLEVRIAYHPRWKWQIEIWDPNPPPGMSYGANGYLSTPKYDGFTTKRKALVAVIETIDDAHRQSEAAAIEII